jgi:hypothetical protein
MSGEDCRSQTSINAWNCAVAFVINFDLNHEFGRRAQFPTDEPGTGHCAFASLRPRIKTTKINARRLAAVDRRCPEDGDFTTPLALIRVRQLISIR